MGISAEQLISPEFPKIPRLRDSYGSLKALADSLRNEGQRHPITMWKDGTVISGLRRHRAHLLLGGNKKIRAVFVDTIEDAAKRLVMDSEDDHLALPWKWSEVCRLWELMRRLDAPAALTRAEIARRQGVELRRKTFAGERTPGRTRHRASDYVLSIVGPATGTSETTAKRLWTIYDMATGISRNVSDEKREQARHALAAIDAGDSSISANYDRLVSGREAPRPIRPRPAATIDPAPGRAQIAAWDRSLPQLEGLTAGLTALGPPSADLTWDQVEPAYARLMAVRRDLEKIIKQMRENSQS